MIKPPVSDHALQAAPSVAASDRGRIFLRCTQRFQASYAYAAALACRGRTAPCGLMACGPQCGLSHTSPQDQSMQIRNLGGSGLRVSAVGLGCNNFGQRTDLEASRKVIHKAIDLGITLFDTADIYAGMGGSETVLGTVLGDRRKDI